MRTATRLSYMRSVVHAEVLMRLPGAYASCPRWRSAQSARQREPISPGL